MNKPSFSEVIQVMDGHFQRLPLHQARMQRTCEHFFSTGIELPPLDERLPADLRQGLVKCRLVYSDTLLSVEFSRYVPRQLNSIELVRDDTIDYAFKSLDRSRLERLRQQSGSDEILIIRNGLVTDTSFSNVVFSAGEEFYTPSSYLLAGTQRKYLLQSGKVQERRIAVEDLVNYEMIYLINAMNDLDQAVGFATADIKQGRYPNA